MAHPTKIPLFSARHYEVLASLMGNTSSPEAFAKALLCYFSADNPKFNEARFRKAVTMHMADNHRYYNWTENLSIVPVKHPR